jgi:hypothetical protein
LGLACGVTIPPALIQPMTAKVPSRPSHTGVRACLRQFRRRTWEHRRVSCWTTTFG